MSNHFEPSTRSAQSAPKIWIVDDVLLDARRIVGALTELAECEVFTHGAAMLERVSCGELPDVLVLDWQLPELNGPDLCRFLRERYDEGRLPILLVTVMSGSADVAAGLAAGANDFVRKPFDDVELRARVAGALRTKQLLSRARRAEQALELERKRLQESEARLRRLAESGIIGILIMDLAGNVLEANDTLLELVGYSRADLAAGRVRMRELTSSDYLGADDRAIQALLERGVCDRYEKVLERPDGSQVAVLQGAALLGRDSVIAYLLDVSEQRSLEADRKRLYEAERRARGEAERASLMKDEFLATVSHELRTPLNAILGWAQIARMRPEGTDLGKVIDTIERNARIQAKLIDDILDISRIVSGKVRLELSRVDLGDVVRETLEAVRPAATAKSLEIRQGPLGPAELLGDASRLHQVVWNLLTNAVKFTPAGGWVSVAVERLDDVFRLVVEDNGAGISPDFLPFVFARFRQGDASTTRAQGGLGLGLAIVQHLTEQHGGRAYATSPGLGQGSRFWIDLPIRRELDAAETPVPEKVRPSQVSSVKPLSLAGMRVLLVDDEVDSRGFLAEFLRRHGADVVTAGSAGEAFSIFRSAPPDVLVTDIGMSGEDGYELLRRIRALAPEQGGRVPAIALTAYAREEDARRALAEGFQHHLPKPVDMNRVLETLARLHASA